MSRRSAARKSKLDRLRVVPWIAVAQAGVVIGRHWQALSTKERAELRGLVGRLDLKGIGRELLPLARRRRGRRGRSRART